MMTANEKQIGGDHYHEHSYQHWDWVTDINMSYLEACATKYISRWKHKNGVEDLEKSLHYMQKVQDLARSCEYKNTTDKSKLGKKLTTHFCEQLNITDGYLCSQIYLWHGHYSLDEIIANIKERINQQGDATTGQSPVGGTGSPKGPLDAGRVPCVHCGGTGFISKAGMENSVVISECLVCNGDGFHEEV